MPALEKMKFSCELTDENGALPKEESSVFG